MSLEIQFENHFSLRVMEIILPPSFEINTENDLETLKQAWKSNLKSWHSPYTCLMHLHPCSISQQMQDSFSHMMRFFSQFFMKSIYGFYLEGQAKPLAPFEVICGYDAAAQKVGLNPSHLRTRDLTDLRSRIQIDNDFNAHVMEISFLQETNFETVSDLDILKSKIKNILRMWHTPYSVLINCSNASFHPDVWDEFKKMEKFLKGFFCQKLIGYAPKHGKENYPMQTYRSRHLAAAELDHQGLQSGAMANCSTRK